MEIRTANVNTAFNTLVRVFQTREYCGDVHPWMIHGSKAPIIERPSRNGPVLMIDEPVTITYERPTERVLFNTARDANPFFHVYEALWMLAGRNDVAPLAYYAKQMKEYSDDGGTLNGAYGYRWRHAPVLGIKTPHKEIRFDPPGFCQLKAVVQHLKQFPESRRAVVSMHDASDTVATGGVVYSATGVPAYTKDTPCNLNVLFSIRDTQPDDACTFVACPKYLDMTVFNRSNDLIWGCLGANAVHFSVLQEYMAAQLGVEVGRYNQISNNLHVYLSNFKPEEWLSYYESDDEVEYVPACHIVPLVKDPAVFDEEVGPFVEHWNGQEKVQKFRSYAEPFLVSTAYHMMAAFTAYKNDDLDRAAYLCSLIEADDWRTAATSWIERRREKRAVAKA